MGAASVVLGFKDHLQAIFLIFVEGDMMHEDSNSLRCTSSPVSMAQPD